MTVHMLACTLINEAHDSLIGVDSLQTTKSLGESSWAFALPRRI